MRENGTMSTLLGPQASQSAKLRDISERSWIVFKREILDRFPYAVERAAQDGACIYPILQADSDGSNRPVGLAVSSNTSNQVELVFVNDPRRNGDRTEVCFDCPLNFG
jgi:hypothetical protein